MYSARSTVPTKRTPVLRQKDYKINQVALISNEIRASFSAAEEISLSGQI